jgi:hypothetical protein
VELLGPGNNVATARWVSHLGKEFLTGQRLEERIMSPRAAPAPCPESQLPQLPEDAFGEALVNSFFLATSTATTKGDESVSLVGLWLGVALLLGLTCAGYWRILTKANEPGWAALIPIYGMVKLLRIGGRSGWWALLAFVPYVGIIADVVQSISLARVFGKGVPFGIGLLLLPFVFAPILGFGSAEYIGTAPDALNVPRQEPARVG